MGYFLPAKKVNNGTTKGSGYHASKEVNGDGDAPQKRYLRVAADNQRSVWTVIKGCFVGILHDLRRMGSYM